MSARVDPIPREARVFQGHRAGLVTRGAATAIDVGVVTIVLALGYLGVCVVLFLTPPKGFEAPVPPLWLDLLIGYVVTTLYWAIVWNRGGRSYGCHIMGLRVVDRQGRLLGIVPALLRAAFCVAFPLGFVWVAFSRANRSVQDVVLRTSVIYDWDVRPRTREVRVAEGASGGDADDGLLPGDPLAEV